MKRAGGADPPALSSWGNSGPAYGFKRMMAGPVLCKHPGGNAGCEYGFNRAAVKLGRIDMVSASEMFVAAWPWAIRASMLRASALWRLRLKNRDGSDARHAHRASRPLAHLDRMARRAKHRASRRRPSSRLAARTRTTSAEGRTSGRSAFT